MKLASIFKRFDTQHIHIRSNLFSIIRFKYARQYACVVYKICNYINRILVFVTCRITSLVFHMTLHILILKLILIALKVLYSVLDAYVIGIVFFFFFNRLNSEQYTYDIFTGVAGRSVVMFYYK